MKFKSSNQRKAVMAKLKNIPMRDIINLNEKKGKFWFKPKTLKFFNSRFGGTVVEKVGTKRAFFVSSEKGPNEQRRYSVRKVNLKTGDIDTVGDFNRMTELQAKKKLKTILKH